MKTATVKVGDLNTIAALTFHINYYIVGVLQLLQGGKLEIRDQFSFDLPLIKTQSDWERLRAQLWNNAGLLALALERVNAEDFGTPFVDPRYGTYERNINGMIEHAYYHLGQLVLIKKLLQSKE